MKLNEVAEVKAGDLEQVQNYKSGDLDIYHKKLVSLEGCPEKIDGSFVCGHNKQLNSFEYFPKYIKDDCVISFNSFTSFKDIDKHIKYIGDELYAIGMNMNITSGYSDLFCIDGLQRIIIDDKKVMKIVNRYLNKEKDLIEFQDEMIKAGYERYL